MSSVDEENDSFSAVNRQRQQIRNIETNIQQHKNDQREKKRIDKLTYKDKDDIYG